MLCLNWAYLKAYFELIRIGVFELWVNILVQMVSVEKQIKL